ncbi:MAG: hypothetical protein ACXVJT_18430, partial [Thermoanaerobaculia bacterium]
TGAGALRDIAISNGYLIFGADRLGTLDLSSQTSTPIYTGDPCGSDLALEVVGGYAFTAMADCFGDGEINVYDVSTPSQPRYLRSQGFGYSGFNFTGLAALGSDYIVAVSNLRPGNVGHDVVVIDRRDVYNMKKVADIDIPNFDAFRVKAVGTTIYVAGVDGGLAVLDLSTPSAPVITGIVHTPGYPRSVDAIGAMLAVADGSSGATFVDISPVGLPTILGNQATSGTAWECAFNGATLYVVNEQGLAVIDSLATAPLIDRTLIINASANGGTMATVTGSAKAILGLAPVTIEVHNVTTGATISGLSVASDGSFQALITGSPGNALTIKATDTVGRVSGPLSIGTVPFGSQTHITTITPAMTDANFLARNVATAGNYLAVGSYPTGNGSSDKIVLFDVTDRANPVYKRTVTTGAGALRDMAIVNGYLVFGADRLGTLDLSSQTSAPIFTGDPCGSDLAVEVVGGYAFAAMADCFGDGEINVYDVSTPSQPRYLRSQGFGYSGFNFTGLAALGSDYLVGVSNLRPGNV